MLLRDAESIKKIKESLQVIIEKVNKIEEILPGGGGDSSGSLDVILNNKVSKDGDDINGVINMKTSTSKDSLFRFFNNNILVGEISIDKQNNNLVLFNTNKSGAKIELCPNGIIKINAVNLNTPEKEVIDAINSLYKNYNEIIGNNGESGGSEGGSIIKISWDNILNKPTSFPPGDNYYTKEQIDTELNTIKDDLEKVNISILTDDVDIDKALSEEHGPNEQHDFLVTENDLYSVNSLNKILNAIKTNTPIKDTSNISTELLLRYPVNKHYYKRGDIIIKNKKLAKITNTGQIKHIYSVDFALFIQTFDNRLFVSGINTNGQYGDGTTTSDKKIHQIPIPQKPIKKFCTSGSKSNVLLYEDNEIYVWGSNNYGCCGVGHNNPILSPQKVNFPTNVNIIDIDSKGHRDDASVTALILEDGSIYVAGYTVHGVGLGDGYTESSTTTFKKVDTSMLDGKPIKCLINTKNDHCNLYVITDKGKMYASGHNQYGGLVMGVSNDNVYKKLTLCAGIPSNAFVEDVFVGHQNAFIKTKTDIFVTGWNYDGSLGIGLPEGATTVKPASEIISHPLFKPYNTKFITSPYHTGGRGEWYVYTWFLLENGDVYACGYNLDNSYHKDIGGVVLNNPIKISKLPSIREVGGDNGSNHFLSYDGIIYCKGENAYGECGEYIPNADGNVFVYPLHAFDLDRDSGYLLYNTSMEDIEDERLQYL